MEIKYLETNKILPYINNPRKNLNADKVASSIKEFGFQQPIVVDKEMIIIVGHTRHQAAKLLGLKTVPVVIADLPPLKAKAYRIADNRLNEDSEWDMGLLNIEFTDLLDNNFEMENLGFDDKELERLIVGDEKGLTDDDDVPDLPKEPNAKLGDIYQLGEHRLMCGDSTEPKNLKKLLNNQKVEMVFTDPPYNALKSWKKNEAKSETRLNPNDWFENDNMEWEDYNNFLFKSFNNYNAESIYICCDYRIYPMLTFIIKKINYILKHCIVWKKNIWGLGKRYRFQHEFIIYATKKDNTIFYGDNSQSDVWEVAVDRSKEHKTPKPVKLVEKAILNSSKKNNIVLDSFLGSGTTLIACEKTNRKCFGLELSPKYVDVIIKRWEDYTGKKAELING
tara:strand:- start:689 stop:1867 length:1179 start_codon:yes stop_codon:yes gene_type:complete